MIVADIATLLLWITWTVLSLLSETIREHLDYTMMNITTWIVHNPMSRNIFPPQIWTKESIQNNLINLQLRVETHLEGDVCSASASCTWSGSGHIVVNLSLERAQLKCPYDWMNGYLFSSIDYWFCVRMLSSNIYLCCCVGMPPVWHTQDDEQLLLHPILLVTRMGL